MTTALHPLVPAIDGSTDVYVIVGDPVQQVQAPTSFNRIFALTGINAVLVPVQVAAADLQAFARSVFLGANVKGLWITIPHKSTVLPWLDNCSEPARTAGAVNAVRRTAAGGLEGDIFDGDGFIGMLDHYRIAYAGQKILILGAGGAAAAIGAALALNGARAPALLAFYDPVTGQAARTAERLCKAAPVPAVVVQSNDPAGYDLVVNASPLGLKASDPLPCDVARMEAHAAAADILMKNQPTPWVQAARARGLVAQPGFEMLIQQTHRYLDFFGFADAARHVRGDADFLRRLVYPQALQHEIRPERSTATMR